MEGREAHFFLFFSLLLSTIVFLFYNSIPLFKCDSSAPFPIPGDLTFPELPLGCHPPPFLIQTLKRTKKQTTTKKRYNPQFQMRKQRARPRCSYEHGRAKPPEQTGETKTQPDDTPKKKKLVHREQGKNTTGRRRREGKNVCELYQHQTNDFNPLQSTIFIHTLHLPKTRQRERGKYRKLLSFENMSNQSIRPPLNSYQILPFTRRAKKAEIKKYISKICKSEEDEERLHCAGTRVNG